LPKFSIRDIENITGIKAHTLRIWEQRYNFLIPKRTDTNIRYYDDDDLRFIINVSILNNYGVKISEISKMNAEKIQEMVLVVSEKSTPYDSQIKALTSAMFSLDEVAYNKILNTNILKQGLEDTMENIVFPFMHQIGIMWITGSIHPAHEHFISNLTKQKLHVAIDGQTGKKLPDAKRFLLFLPEGEPHELGLLLANYMLRSRCQEVVYLGPNMPFEDLKEVFDFHEPQFVVSSLTSGDSNENLQAMIDKLSISWPEARILLTGSQVLNNTALKFPQNVEVIKSIKHFASVIDSVKELCLANGNGLPLP